MAKKDPAFLFYSKDFYEGTRLMLPEERACMIDLMIYQHQNGGIPNDTKRLALYCSGISEDVIINTLKLKFKLIDTEWYSDKMTEVVTERKEKGNKNKLIGTFAHVLRKLELSKSDTSILKKRFNVDELLKIDTEWNTERLTEWCLNGIPFIEDEDAISISNNISSNSDKITFELFWDKYHKITQRNKTDKEPTEKYWKKLTKAEKQNAIDNISNHFNSVSDKKYCKKARTYLSDKVFNDEVNGATSYNQEDISARMDKWGSLTMDEKNKLKVDVLKIPLNERSQREATIAAVDITLI